MPAWGGSGRCSCGRGAEEEGPEWAALTPTKDREHTFLPRTPKTSATHPCSAARRFESSVTSSAASQALAPQNARVGTGRPACLAAWSLHHMPAHTALLGICDCKVCMYLWAWLWGMEKDHLYVAKVGARKTRGSMELLPKEGVQGWAWEGLGSGEAGPGLRHRSCRAGTWDPQTGGSPRL